MAQSVKAGRTLTKVTVRLLPAALPQEIFMKSIEPYIANTNYVFYQKGKARVKDPVTSVAFINFKDQATAESFYAVYNNHPFIDSKGKEDRAQVEWAIYQRVPKPRKRADIRAGTIDADPDYQAFVQKHLNPVVEHLPSAEVQLDKRLAEERELMAQNGGQLPPIITPLIADLKAKKLAKLNQQRARQADKSQRRRRDKKGVSAAPQQPAPQESTRGRPRGKRRDRGKKTSVTAERGTMAPPASPGGAAKSRPSATALAAQAAAAAPGVGGAAPHPGAPAPADTARRGGKPPKRGKGRGERREVRGKPAASVSGGGSALTPSDGSGGNVQWAKAPAVSLPAPQPSTAIRSVAPPAKPSPKSGARGGGGGGRGGRGRGGGGAPPAQGMTP